LDPPCVTRLGAEGPELAFAIDDAPAQDLNQTLVIPAAPPERESAAAAKDAADSGPGKPHEDLLSDAVLRARLARRMGIGDSTVVIMREMLDAALHRTGRKFKAVIAVLACALVAVSAFGFWKIDWLKKQKRQIDGEIQQIEARLARADQNSTETDRAIDRPGPYGAKAVALRETP